MRMIHFHCFYILRHKFEHLITFTQTMLTHMVYFFAIKSLLPVVYRSLLILSIIAMVEKILSIHLTLSISYNCRCNVQSFEK